MVSPPRAGLLFYVLAVINHLQKIWGTANICSHHGLVTLRDKRKFMTHTYNITGMTCNNCVASVKNDLLKTPHITAADVQLNAPQATITMDKHLPVAQLQQAITNPKYKITEANESSGASIEMATENNSYYPIFLIFGFIAGVTVLSQLAKGGFNLVQWMDSFMAGFFLVFSFFKLLNIKGFVEGYSTYDLVAKHIPAYGYVYPFIELALGIAYLTGFNIMVTNIATLVVMSISSVGVIQSLLKKNDFQCACLGTIIKLPLSKVTLFEDLLMVAMSIVMLIKYMFLF